MLDCVRKGFEEEPPQEQLSEEDELYVVYDVHAMSRSEISVPLKTEDQDCLMHWVCVIPCPDYFRETSLPRH